MARTLVKTGEEFVPVRVFNPTSSNKVVQKNTHLASMTLVAEEEVEKDPNCWKLEDWKIPEHLVDLLERSTEEMPGQYHQDVAKLLAEFQDVYIFHVQTAISEEPISYNTR